MQAMPIETKVFATFFVRQGMLVCSCFNNLRRFSLTGLMADLLKTVRSLSLRL